MDRCLDILRRVLRLNKEGTNLVTTIKCTLLLDTLDGANLGVWIGNVNVAVSGVAYDVYLMADTQSKLQAQMDIASYYGETGTPSPCIS